MIELYSGTPGSGKSLDCASEIYFKIMHGKNIIANFEINETVFPKRKKNKGLFVFIDDCDITPKLLQDLALSYHKKNKQGHIIEGQTTIILDECGMLFNPRDWQAPERKEWARFFQQHRKYGFNVILITQFDRLIDRQIRSVIEYEVIHRKVSNFQFIGFLLGLFFKGNVFVGVTYWYPVKERMSAKFFVLLPRYGKMYDSYKIFDGQAEAGDKGVPARTDRQKVNKPKNKLCEADSN
jgi:zona occludens toxin